MSEYDDIKITRQSRETVNSALNTLLAALSFLDDDINHVITKLNKLLVRHSSKHRASVIINLRDAQRNILNVINDICG